MLAVIEYYIELMAKLIIPLGGETFWSTVLGAVIATLTSYAMQLRAVREAKAAEHLKNLRERQSLAYSLIIKMLIVRSQYEMLAGLLDDAKKRATSKGPKVPLEATLFPVANLPDEIEYSPKEIENIYTICDDALFKSIFLSDRTFNGCIKLWELYGRKRDETFGNVKTKFDARDGRVEFEVDGDGRGSILSFEVKNLALDIESQTRIGLNEINKILESTKSTFKEKIEIDISI